LGLTKFHGITYTGRLEKKRSGQINVNEKVHYNHEKLNVTTAIKFNVTDILFARYNALVHYKEKDYDVTL